MAVTEKIINKIRKVEYSSDEPKNTNVLWAEPAGNNLYNYRVFDNGQWNLVSSGGGEIPTNISYFYNDVGYITMEDLPSDLYEIPETGIPSTDLDSDVQASLGKADTALQSYTETDPTVPSWAKAESKPSYTASEVGAVPTTRTVNGKALSADITLTASDVSALPASTVIPAAPGTLNTDNTTAQTASSSEALSGAIKLHKVSKTGSYNDLLNKPTIPAAQVQSDWNATTGMGVILNKPTIPTVPTNVSAFTNDAGYLTSHQDISGKADKVTSATNGDFAGLDANGNLTDSGVASADIVKFSPDNGIGIVPEDGIRVETVSSGATISVNPDVVTVISGAVGTAAITLQVPSDSLAHVWDILMTTDSTVSITFAMSDSTTIKVPSGFTSPSASKSVEISVIGTGTTYYLRYGEFA